MLSGIQLNKSAAAIVQQCIANADRLRIATSEIAAAKVLDFGVETLGGLEAGLQLARICMSDMASISLEAPSSVIPLPQVVVRTDHPLAACLHSQYAGWKIATEDYFAMGSGPMRAAAATEPLFTEFPAEKEVSSGNAPTICVGVLEASTLPTDAAVAAIKSGLASSAELILAVAPTSSQAGNLQVVARSVETAMHKLHELHFPVQSVVSAAGAAPLPPVAKNDLQGIGRTNDSILYGSTVNLWVDCDDETIQAAGPKTPSNSSPSHGEQFLSLFKKANHDFYAMDKDLFSPALVIFHSVKTGNSYQFGTIVPELLHQSFAM
ncbi:MAG: methenyltetrahydromethanopterin cyclohydrolase [Fuerstiella sp.]